MKIHYTNNMAGLEQIREHLIQCNNLFVPPLTTKVDIGEYAGKLMKYATRFEAWHEERLVGLVAVYMNDQVLRTAFVTNVSVLSEYSGMGIASTLAEQSMKVAQLEGYNRMELEVFPGNEAAMALYKKLGFVSEGQGEDAMQRMSKYV